MLFTPAIGWRASGGNDSFTKLLLHFDGSDASTTFTDSSAGAHSVTAGNSGQLDTAQKKFGTASLLVGDSTDYALLAGHADYNFGTSAFAVDYWIKTSKATVITAISPNAASSSANWWGIVGNFGDVSGDLAVYEQTTSRISASGTGWNNGSFHHVALTREGNNVRLFLDGTQIGSTYVTSFTYGNSTDGLIIGTPNGGGAGVNGWMDEVRISKGVARWSSNFTPPTVAYS